ncbi:Flp pilus assembly protein TadD/cell division protein FtsN [Novosphingobium lubricantis]|jgi:Flp pilus assembly protein TadD/cell division protein FtsN
MLHRVTALVPSRTARLIVSSALAAGILTGCASGSVHPAKLASAAQAELERGRLNGAIDKAEKAVLADPRNPAYRVLLGNAYLKAGRFESARQAYDESMELGEDSGRTALSLALADIALGMHAEAIDTLGAYRDSLDVTDYGLALTLAGQPAQGVAVLSDALRNGENTPKLRQNLALSYALHGRWREARVMAAQDVPAAELADRLERWATMGYAEHTRERVAGLLSVPVRADDGQPAALALANFPATEQLAAEAARRAPARAAAATRLAEAAVQELAPIDAAPGNAPSLDDSSSQSQRVQMALIDLPPANTAPAVPLARREVPVGPAVPARAAVALPREQAPVAGAAPLRDGTHLVQLGAFSSADGAHRAWRHLSARNPALKGHERLITQATVNGRQYWRLQAAGFAGLGSARSMCGTVKARGSVCMVLRDRTGTVPGQRAMETRMAKR